MNAGDGSGSARSGDLKADLRYYLRHRAFLFSAELCRVASELNRYFDSSFRLDSLLPPAEGSSARPVVEVCEKIVAHHVRLLGDAEREPAARALFDSFIHFAGSPQPFDRFDEGKFVKRLRASGRRGFIAVFLSLYLFNVICLEVPQEGAEGAAEGMEKRRGGRSFDLYRLNLEAECRKLVDRSMRTVSVEPDELWAEVVARNLELQLISGPRL